MKALVYQGPGCKSLLDTPKPGLREATDAVVRFTKMKICGTDLPIFQGDVPTVREDRILGHDGTGILAAYDTFGHAAREHALKVILSCES
jgi:alcohol dehydrogenase